MEWYEPLYVSDSMQKKVKRIKWRLNHNAGVLQGYLITFPTNDDNLMDIYPMKSLKFSKYLRNSLKVIGIAKTYEEAVDMVTSIVDETYQNTHTADVKNYLYKKGNHS